jgi:hypothetical protein
VEGRHRHLGSRRYRRQGRRCYQYRHYQCQYPRQDCRGSRHLCRVFRRYRHRGQRCPRFHLYQHPSLHLGQAEKDQPHQ